ncbi:class I SAM-dependent methyltransferase [Parendozoicomonas sp. Alg238-R29]|uniref:class I SAM-dependent methyltransferase n=1 Tax=Parendozoicomonas sp. Alg238-R29 TaxID=2993446 RepID=UPI00248F2856|nr:class I SAM-dependent methyltransferase [Parendozoicomonas sp. Alg238-R29]
MMSCKTVMTDLVCPLCGGTHNVSFWKDKYREYLRCQECELVFVPKAWHLSPTDEKACYDLHENVDGDPGYQRFLFRMFSPITELVAPPATGLDFGCGPGPVLAEMFAEAGYSMNVYDLYYADNPDVLDRTYDFVTSTEVVEHLGNPRDVLARLLDMVKPGGFLGLMTKLVKNQEAFQNWHYIRDKTHISFFSRETFQWFANQTGCELEFVGNDVILLKKPENMPEEN